MNTVKRLKKYVEFIQHSMLNSSGALKEFWERELKKTLVKIGKLS